jgi:hypothetical protein
LKKIFTSKTLQFAALLIILLMVHYSVVFSFVKADPDAKAILGTLSDVNSALDYFSKLFNFHTLDFQPFRDITLLVDLFIFNHLNVNSFVFQNILWWLGSLWLIHRILRHEHETLTEKQIFIGVLLFTIYPLFSMSLPWGMARKHILAFFFTILATERLVTSRESLSFRNGTILCLSYLLAILSQPIGILWALWSCLYVWLIRPELKQSFSRWIPALLLIFFSLSFVNYRYYTTSAVFLHNYSAKTTDLINILNQLLALGHYVTALLFPYMPSFHVTIQDRSTLIGLPLLLLVAAALFKFSRNKQTFIWAIFFFFPLMPVLLMPEMMQDTYLLLPAFAFFMILMGIPAVKKLHPSLYIATAVLWFYFSGAISSDWTTGSKRARADFRNSPNCLSAFYSAKFDLSRLVKPPPEVMEYLHFGCYKHIINNAQHLEAVKCVHSMYLYQTDSIRLENKLRALDEEAKNGHLCAMTWKTSLLIKENKTENLGEDALAPLISGYSAIKQPVYDSAISKIIYPYCTKNGFKSCEKVLSPFTVKPVTPYD